MKPLPLRNPADVLRPVIASEIEVIRSRDPELSRILNVEPRPIEHEGPRPTAAPPEQLTFTRRALRKAYRALKRIGPLDPVLQQIRSNVLERLERKNLVKEERETLATVTRSFTIAFTMRSGSNEICSLLAKNGLGSPGEFFQKPLPGMGSGLVLDSFSRIVSRYQIDGVFGSKMSHDHRAALDEQLRSVVPGYTRIDDLLPSHRWVWLKRRDKILQAISWCRAESTNRWAESGQQNPAATEYAYDFLHVLSRIMMIHGAELAWEQYFKESAIEPLIVYYEDFFQDVDQQLPRLIRYLGGLPGKRSTIDKSTTFAIQRSDRSYEIQKRFVADLKLLGSSRLTTELGEPLQRWVRFMFEYGWRG